MHLLQENILNAYLKIHGDHDVRDTSDPEKDTEFHKMCFHKTQRPWEFFAAWDVISKHIPEKKELSFLEIGAAKGLWSIAFIEFCKFYNKTPTYVTVSWTKPPYLEPHEIEWNNSLIKVKEFYPQVNWHWIDENSNLESSRDRVVEILPKYDYVFIDGLHTYDAVKKDTELYKPLASTLLMYHDIQGRTKGRHSFHGNTYNVYGAIEDSGVCLHHQIISKFSCEGDSEGIGIHVVNT